MEKCHVIAVTNQKGGVGKTTTTVNLGVGLARMGKRVLLVDADPQGSLTVSLGVKNPDELPVSIATVMQNTVDDKVMPQDYPRLQRLSDAARQYRRLLESICAARLCQPVYHRQQNHMDANRPCMYRLFFCYSCYQNVVTAQQKNGAYKICFQNIRDKSRRKREIAFFVPHNKSNGVRLIFSKSRCYSCCKNVIKLDGGAK